MQRIALALALTLSLAAPAQKIKTSLVNTEAHPSSVATLPSSDGSYYLFLTVTNNGGSGIQVFHAVNGKLDRQGLIRLGNSNAQGIVLIPHTHTLAVGVSEEGVAFVDIDEAFKGHPHPIYLTQGDRSGAGYLAATPDGQYLFVANEYGMHGNAGVIALHPDAAGHITSPETIGHIPAPSTTPGLTLSPDGTRLYIVSESGGKDANPRFSGADNSQLMHGGCKEGPMSPERPNGLLYVVDVARATALKPSDDTEAELIAGKHTIIARSNAGCSPVRLTESADGTALYLANRGENKIFVFDPRKLDSDPGHAFLRAIPTGGTAPVGLHLFANDTKLLIANSNRFDGGTGNATILDLTTGKIEQKLNTGLFPRNIGISPDGNTLYLSNFNSGTLEVIPVAP